jgi:hypothetical protein
MGCNCKGSRPQTRTKIVENTTIIQPEPITLEYMIGDEKPPFSSRVVVYVCREFKQEYLRCQKY